MKTDIDHCCKNCANWKKQRGRHIKVFHRCTITGMQCYWWEGIKCKIFKRKKVAKK